MLEEAMDARAMAAASRTSELQSQLRNLKGDLSSRIETLASAFAAYVELDGIREQLSAFPQHNQARRLAGVDLDILLKGGTPEPRADVPGYWLVPAVQALRPDGTVDAELAAQATAREELSTRRFLLTAQAALGQGPELVDELVELMAPEDRAGVATWDEVQVMWWASVLRGAFGPKALAALRPLAEPAIATLTGTDWLDWAEETASAARIRSFGRTKRSDTANLTWLGDQLSAATEPVDQTTDDNSWRMSWQAPPTSKDADAPAVEGGPTSADDPDAAARSNREMLAGLAKYLIAEGSVEEQHLLERASELRRELAGMERGAAVSEPDQPIGLPSKPAAVVDEVRSTAVDEHASLADRRELWSWLAPNLRAYFTSVIEAEPPVATVLPAQSKNSLLVGANGVIESSDLQRAELQLARDYAPAPLTRYGPPITVVGGGLVALGVVLGLATNQPWFWVLVVLGLVGVIVGGWQWSRRREVTGNLERARERLESRIREVQANAERTDRANLGRHTDMVEAARRSLNMLPE